MIVWCEISHIIYVLCVRNKTLMTHCNNEIYNKFHTPFPMIVGIHCDCQEKGFSLCTENEGFIGGRPTFSISR